MFLDFKEIFDEKYIVYAHTKKDGENETLAEHIDLCESYFKKLDKEKNINFIIENFCNSIVDFKQNQKAKFLLREMVFQIIVFHDLGKCNPIFQRNNMKNKNLICEKFEGVSGSNHSLLSAILYLDYYLEFINNEDGFSKEEKRILEILLFEHSFVIARHHSDFENFSDYINVLKSDEIKKLLDFLSLGKIKVYKGPKTLTYEKIKKLSYRKMKENNSKSQNLLRYFYYRLLYSVLVFCDYYATGEVINGISKKNFGNLKEKEKYIEAYNNSEIIKNIRSFQSKNLDIKKEDFENFKEINLLRNCMFLETEIELLNSENENIYFIEAPTGSGKSNMALNLSFHLMKDKNKLFYIYPFNTLIEQNKANLRELFSEEDLAEQIAVVNSITPFKESKEEEKNTIKYYQNTLLDRQFLNYPIILSTHISFFNILFSCNREDLFGFLQLSNSVIVLDEIQSYRNSIWAEIIIMLQACAELMGMKIIIMSATLPNLEVLGGELCRVKYLLKNSQKYFKHYLFKNRVNISYELLNEYFDLEKLLEHIEENYSKDKKVLVEFISKKTAEKFYDMVCSSDKIIAPKYCITGDLSIYEREKILKPIRKNEEIQCILVATQVIEAGVDIDMDIGYKDISKLDSEEQFLGRINRSFKRNGKVYFFDYDNEKKIYKDDYRIDENLTLRNKEMREILFRKDFSIYYKEVLKLIKQNINENTDKIGLDSFFEEIAILSYYKIAERMKLILDDKWSIDIFLSRLIYFDDGVCIDGRQVWEQYKELLRADIDYAEKQVKLSEVKSKMNYFVYSVKKNINIPFNEMIGEIRFIENGEKYFVDGILKRELLEEDNIFLGD